MIKNLFNAPSGNKSSAQTLIGRGCEITGDLRFSGGLYVDGRIKGDVSSVEGQAANLSISESGEIEGDVSVANVVVNGSIHGQLEVAERLTLGAKSKVNGDVRYRLLRMEPGATVNGQLICVAEKRQEALEHVKAPAKAGKGGGRQHPEQIAT